MRTLFFSIIFLWGSLHAKVEVLVSIAPQKFLVEQIGGPYVAVDIIVPPNANAHTYEPTPKQILMAQKKQLWFRLGEGFETRILPSLERTVRIIDQRKDLDLIKGGAGRCCGQDAFDPHIWLSPCLLKVQARQIALALQAQDPENAQFYQHNLLLLEQQLEQLNQELTALFAHAPRRTILVSHPAFGYFCRDYGLVQLSIETEGREPTPKTLTGLIDEARRLKITTVFLQKQHNPKGGIIVAKEIGAVTCYVDPYIENVIENLRTISHLFYLSFEQPVKECS